MKIVVIDTSALIRLYVPDGDLPEELEKTIDEAWHADTVIMAPELLFAEAAQVLLKKEKAGYLQNDEADEILSSIMELPIERVSHYDLLPDALVVARQYNLTVYDALFLALAKNRHARLISGDRHLAKTFAAI